MIRDTRSRRGTARSGTVLAVAVAAGAAVALALAGGAPATASAQRAVAAPAAPVPAPAHPGGGPWVTTWSASPQVAVPGTLSATGFDNQTVRDIVFTSAGGNAARVVLTNVFGTSPLRVGHVTLAIAGSGAAVRAGTVARVSFGGSSSIEIPPGAQALSDPVTMRVPALTDLAVSVYLPGQTGAATIHSDAQQDNWVSGTGDHAGDAGAGAFTTDSQSWYYVSDVIVRSPGAAGTVVAFGDSITDGFQSTVNANARWPNDLARRLEARHGPALSVADEGISGDRVLNDSLCCGVN